MDNHQSRSGGVWVRPDNVAPSTPKRLKCTIDDSGMAGASRLFVEPVSEGTARPRFAPSGGLLRQASHVELSLSYPSPPKNIARNSPLKSIQPRTPATFDSMRKIEPVKFRKCHTDPLFHALCAELKKATGTTPQVPERQEHPFESANLADRMSEAWTSPTMFADAPKEAGFQWGVHHLAELQPVDLDNKVDLLRTELLKHVHDDTEEEHAQASILRFFNGVCDIPSPNSREPASSMFADLDSENTPAVVISGKKRKRDSGSAKDIDCQTEITISPNFDFDKYFADFKIKMSQIHPCRPSEEVRRKLFAEESENDDAELDESTGFAMSPRPNRSSDFGIGASFDLDMDLCLSSVEDNDDV